MKDFFLSLLIFLLIQANTYSQVNYNAIRKIVIADSLFYKKKYDKAIFLYKDILKEKFFPENLIYYNISYSFYQKQELDSAILYMHKSIDSGLKKWSVNIVMNNRYISNLSKFDSTIIKGIVNNTKRWLESDSLAHYKKLRDSLFIVKKTDQENRGLKKIDDKKWALQKTQDSLNLLFVTKKIDKIGKWLGFNEVGKTGESACFLALQHSEDIKIYEKYYSLLHKAILINNAPASHYAMFIDRWFIYKNNTQFFGTQVKEVSGQARIKGTLVYKKYVDKLREYFDLPPLSYYLKEMTKLYQDENR